MKFTFAVQEIYRREETFEAENIEDAIKLVNKKYNKNINLTKKDFLKKDIVCTLCRP